MADLRKYGVAATIDGVPLVKFGANDFKANPTIAAGDVKISKDGGAFTNPTTLPTVTPASGEFVQITLSATEMQAARIAIKFVDQTAPKEWEDQAVIIETYGNASASHEFDLDAASVAQTGDSFARIGATGSGLTSLASQASLDTLDNFVDTEVAAILAAVDTEVATIVAAVDTEVAAIKAKTDFLPSVSAGAAGGLFIAGANAPTSVDTALTANITGNLSGSVGSVTGSVGSVTAGVTLAASAVQAVWDALTSALTTAGSVGKKLADWVIGSAQTGDSFARLGAPAGASVSADISAVKVDTAATLARLPASLGPGGRMDASVGDIQAAAHAQLFTQNSGASYAGAVAGSIVKEIVSNVSGGGGGGGAWSLATSGRVRVERPSSGSAAENIHLYVENSSGAPIAADSTPTVTATFVGGSDQSANLGAVTSPHTGHYVVPYNVASTHSQPVGVYVEFTVVVGGVTKRIGVTFDVVSHNTTLGSLTALLTGVNVTRVQSTSLTTKTGQNFKTFFDNNGALTTKVVDNTGGTATVGVTLGAIMAVASVGNRIPSPLLLEMFQAEAKLFPITLLDDAGAPVSLQGKTLIFIVEDSSLPAVDVFTVSGAGVVIGPSPYNVVTITVPQLSVPTAREDLQWRLVDNTTPSARSVMAWGALKVKPCTAGV